MAIESLLVKPLVEISLEVVKKGLETTIEKLKEGVNIEDALSEGVDGAFDKLTEIMSPEKVENLESNSLKITELQDKIEQNPDSVLDNPQSFVEDFTKAKSEIENIVSEINSMDIPSNLITNEIVGALEGVLEIVKQIKEIEIALKEVGIDVDAILKEILSAESFGEVLEDQDNVENMEDGE